MGLLCLFETPAGFALFNVHNEGVLDDVDVRARSARWHHHVPPFSRRNARRHPFRVAAAHATARMAVPS